MSNKVKAKGKSPKVQSLVFFCKLVEDFRVNRTLKHLLCDILVIAVLTYMCGYETYEDMEEFTRFNLKYLRKFLELPGGVPSHDTFRRVLQLLKPEALEKGFEQWVNAIRKKHGKAAQVALDGKALRGAKNGKNGEGIPYIVGAWADTMGGLYLGQVQVQKKSNEIKAIPEILEKLELKGCLVTIDAIGTNKKIAEKILKQDADYCLALKMNQKNLYEDIQLYFEGILNQKLIHDYHWDDFETQENKHGRKEERRYGLISHDVDWIEDPWPGLKAVGMVRREWEENGKQYQQTRYYILSRKMNAQDFLKAVRGHWGIENNLHWVMDVTFGEDRCRAREKYAAQNLALLRRLTYNLILVNRDPKRSIRRHRVRCAMDKEYMMNILMGEKTSVV